MRFQSENTVFKFIRRSVHEALGPKCLNKEHTILMDVMYFINLISLLMRLGHAPLEKLNRIGRETETINQRERETGSQSNYRFLRGF